MSVCKLLLVATLLASTSSARVFGPIKPLESIHAPPPRFTSLGPAPPDQVLQLRIALQQNDLNGLETKLYEISTPGNLQYGAWLSTEEVAAFVSPTEETISLVGEWLAGHNISSKKLDYVGSWLGISATVSQANEILGTTFETFIDSSTQSQTVRTLSYSLPEALLDHVNLVYPTVTFPPATDPALPLHRDSSESAPPARLVSTAPASCAENTNVTPACIQALYGIPTDLVNNTDILSFYITEYNFEWMDYPDLSMFLTEFRPDLDPNTTFSIVTIDGGSNNPASNAAGVEASLDIEYAVSVASGAPVTMLAGGPQSFGNDTTFLEAFLGTADYLVTLDNPATVVSTSYGVQENDISPALATAVCNAFMQVAARGTSVIFSSGDGGVAGSTEITCTGESFIPAFPATCPYITSVGATQFSSSGTEVAVSAADWASGGGFSNIFPRPSYQNATVPPYLSSLGSTNTGLYNASGRGYPDVAAFGVGYTIICELETLTNVAGTSISAPIFASIITLINDKRFSAGKPALGFLNPFLYSNVLGTAFTDIVEGDNPGCGTNGFSAGIGWDPVTGLGTPVFDQLLNAAMSV